MIFPRIEQPEDVFVFYIAEDVIAQTTLLAAKTKIKSHALVQLGNLPGRLLFNSNCL